MDNNQLDEANKSMGKAIEAMNKISTLISAAIVEQGLAKQESSRNIQEASTGTSEVMSIVSNGSIQTGTSSQQNQASSKELAHQVEKMRLTVEAFIQGVRAV
ncbi:MAG: hypothetical protein V7776_22250 [Halopseudomonas aestusnigri]